MSEKSLNIVFMGTPDFAVPALRNLIESRHNVVAVYTQPPRPKGRGHKLQASPVHHLADEHDIPVHTPEKFKKNENAIAEFKALEADIAVVAAYGLILPQPVLDAPQYGCLNIHASLLPRWRGAAPIQYAIWKGDEETGITIMQMEAGLDTGPMILKENVPITHETTAQSLHDKLASLGGPMTLKVLDMIARTGKVKAEKQNDDQSTYASMLSKEDGQIDWAQNAKDIDQQIRALNPWPGTFFTKNDMTFKVKKATYMTHKPDENTGVLLNKSGKVSCGDTIDRKSVLKLDLIQTPNGKTMSIEDAINGGLLKIGESLTS